MERRIDELRTSIPTAFKSNECQARLQEFPDRIREFNAEKRADLD